MRTTRWICLLPAVVGATMAGCAPDMHEVDQVSAAAEVALEDGDQRSLEALFCDWLEDLPSCIEFDVGGKHGPPALGFMWGAYGQGDPTWSDDVGVFYGRYLGFDQETHGRLDGLWADHPSQPGGYLEGQVLGPDPAMHGSLEGVHWPAVGGSGGFNGTWTHGDRQIVEEIAGTYHVGAEEGRGRFVGVWRQYEEEPEPTVHKLHIRNEIDGRSSMVIGTYYAYYHHDDYAAPGMHFYFGPGDPDSEPARPTYLQEEWEWYPQWPEQGENRDCGCESSMFVSQPPHEVLVPYAEADIELEVLEGRGEVSIVEYPSWDNDYELTIEWNDNPQGGPAWYEVELTFVTD